MMLEPCPPISGRRQDRFRPPHCPRAECSDHRVSGRWTAYKRDGFMTRKRRPQRVRQFRCLTCGRRFIKDAFATTYYLKRPELLLPAAQMLVSGCAHRQIARTLGCAPSTITRLSRRLGDHAQLFLKRLLEQLGSIEEPVVFDHFETFVRSQQERLAIGTAVGQRSWFVYALSGAGYLRMKGRSRKKRALKRDPMPVARGEVARSTRETLGQLRNLAPAGLDLVSDDHPAYRSAVRSLSRSIPATSPPIRHTVFANPDRTPGSDRNAAWARDRAMFAVDLLHRIWRHSQAHHRRETIAFGRQRAMVLGRAALFAVWRNVVKLITERRPTQLTPAMQVGITSKRWTWGDVFAERLFAMR